MGHVNIEIKARCHDSSSIRGILKQKGAYFKGLDSQVDTYFDTPNGRLKLREGAIENSLIFYHRPDHSGPRQSDVHLVQRPTDDMKALLRQALPVKIVVEKQREIYFVGNVKIHLDNIAGLGDFVEIEAIDADGTIGNDRLHQQCRQFMDLFEIRETDLIDCSYSDMLIRRQGCD